MGTSSSYQGPRKPPLLPPWGQASPAPGNSPQPSEPQPHDDAHGDIPASGGPNNGNPQQPENTPNIPSTHPGAVATITSVPTASWSTPKGGLTRFARAGGNGGGGSLARVGTSYVRAGGGARHIAQSARAGKRTAANLASFFSSSVRNGFVRAVESAGLGNFLGRTAQSLLAALVDLLAPSGAIREEAIARKAFIDTTCALFDEFDVDGEGAAALNALTINDLGSIIKRYIVSYVNERFQQELVSRVDRAALNEDDANIYSSQIKEFIEQRVSISFENIDLLDFDWQGQQGQDLIETKYAEAYELLGAEE